ncbi:MAG TPA: BON domain-containing protein, partial [Gammaproteobacteria bacterium]|nr:BON domain-containing protein [Gammaproteobacteria bacterium]
VIACAVALVGASTPLLADSADEQSSDLWQKASLTTTYTLNHQLNPFKIDTGVDNGVATLRGTVDSEVERDLAEELALGVEGIHEVNNELVVNPDASDPGSDVEAAAGERSFMSKVEDASLTARVKSQLLWNSNTSGMQIDVDTNSGIVTLSGTVDSDAEAELAGQIASNTRYVRDVENHLKVSGDQMSIDDKVASETHEAAPEVSDGWITAKVKSSLIYSRNVDGTDINVETDNGVVTLYGHVDSDFERESAIRIARGIKGVKDVRPELEGG